MRDDFTEDVKRILAARAGTVCSNADCRALTAGPQDDGRAVNVGVAAHITGAAAGGPRYNAALSPEERRHSDNGIWLCQNCAKLVDNDVVRFPEQVLRAWKADAENRARNSVGKTAAPERAESDSQRKMRVILPWIGRYITLSQMNTGRAVIMTGPVRGSSHVQLLDCTEFFVKIGKPGADGFSRSISLANIEISFDDSRGCLELQECHG
jgi:hypothetical protein